MLGFVPEGGARDAVVVSCFEAGAGPAGCYAYGWAGRGEVVEECSAVRKGLVNWGNKGGVSYRITAVQLGTM